MCSCEQGSKREETTGVAYQLIFLIPKTNTMTVYTLKKGKPKFDPSNWGDVMLGCIITLMIYFLCLTLSTVNQLNY